MNRLKTIAAILTACAVVVGYTRGTEAYSTAGYKWASSPVPFYVNPSNSDVSTSAATTALQAGMNAWNTQSGTVFRFSYAGQVNDTSTSLDGRNVVIFRNTSNADSPGALATTYSWSQNGSRFDSDIVFWDGAYKLFTGSSGCAYTNGQYGAYIEDIATHELGHSLGLMHSSVSDATMYPTYTQCSTSFRTLATDDIAGAKALYGSAPASTNTAPSVTISTPSNGASVPQGTATTFTGSASDTQDGNLTASLSWTSSLDGPIGTGSGFSRALSAGTHTITANVTDAGGLSGSKQESVTVTVAAPITNTAPTVTIASPANGASVAAGTSTTFSGSASDTQDGNLTSGLVWRSSIDGQIGTGGTFTRTLTAGTHTITATVADSGALTAQRSITVSVAAAVSAPPPSTGSTLTARGYKVKGLTKADLAWSGLTAGSVDIYRNKAKISTTANDGAMTDAIDIRGSGTYTYKVCNAGTSTCSNQAMVSF